MLLVQDIQLPRSRTDPWQISSRSRTDTSASVARTGGPHGGSSSELAPDVVSGAEALELVEFDVGVLSARRGQAGCTCYLRVRVALQEFEDNRVAELVKRDEVVGVGDYRQPAWGMAWYISTAWSNSFNSSRSPR